MIIKSGTGNFFKVFCLATTGKSKECIKEDKRDTAHSSKEGKYFTKKGGRL